MDLIYGFDIGTTSIGWSVIRLSRNDERGQILGMGARIFPEARDTEGTPLNQERRRARLTRRQYRRRRDRRRQLNELLSGAGLLPTFGGDDWQAMSRGTDPYTLRTEGLTRQLTPHELGRAIYHLAKRRHFKGKAIEDQEENREEDADEKKAKTARETTIAALRETGLTLGAYLSARPPKDRKRGVHALREHVRSEFEALLAVQSIYHPVLKDAAFAAALRESIFAQKPVFWRKNTLGQCRLMPEAPLASKASWASCQRRMLEQLNNLAIAGGNQRPLVPEERAAIRAVLEVQASMTWGGVRKTLAPLFKARGQSSQSIRFNLEEGGNPKLLGNPLEARLATIFGPVWEAHPHKQAIREAADTRLRAADYGEIGQRVVILPEADRKTRRSAAAESFIRDFGVTPEQAAELEALSFPAGWDAYSSEAVARLLPELEQGVRLGALLAGPEWSEWRHTNFPNRDKPTGEFVDRLPSPRDKEEARRMRNIRNPTVTRVLNELRKVVNNLLSVHGKPDLIRIELARDIGLSKREREEKSKGMRRLEAQRKKAVEDLQANGMSDPARRDIEKWLLWQESGQRDPYSGAMISFDALFRNGEYEVEHIWPRSLSLDDSFHNLTLCRRDFNQRKGNKTPFDAFGADPDLWQAITARIAEMKAAKGGMSPGKARRFLATSIPEDFASRQLNDTGYAAREAIASLKRLWPDEGPQAPVRVQAVSGKVTAHLRRLWGLNNILAEDGEKTRADHRHHAIDALVVACTHPGMSQRLSRYWQMEDTPRADATKPKLGAPWPGIRLEAEQHVAGIVVSHRVRKKLSGPLHTGTIYGDRNQTMTVGGIEYDVVVERVPVNALSLSDLLSDSLETNRYRISDDGVRSAIEAHLRTNGIDIERHKSQRKISLSASEKKLFDEILQQPVPLGRKGTVIKKVRVLTRKQRHLLIPVHNGLAPKDSNHHFALYRSTDGKITEVPVSLFEAVRRSRRREAIVKKSLEDGSQLMFSISKGDIIAFDDERAKYWVVRTLASHGQILVVPHSEARPDKYATKFSPYLKSLVGKKVRKVSVDPIGRVREAGD